MLGCPKNYNEEQMELEFLDRLPINIGNKHTKLFLVKTITSCKKIGGTMLRPPIMSNLCGEGFYFGNFWVTSKKPQPKGTRTWNFFFIRQYQVAKNMRERMIRPPKYLSQNFLGQILGKTKILHSHSHKHKKHAYETISSFIDGKLE